jgi:hypothetical protein
MKVKLKRSIIADKKQRKAGDVVTLTGHEAKFLISRDLVEEYKETKPAKKSESNK